MERECNQRTLALLISQSCQLPPEILTSSLALHCTPSCPSLQCATLAVLSPLPRLDAPSCIVAALLSAATNACALAYGWSHSSRAIQIQATTSHNPPSHNCNGYQCQSHIVCCQVCPLHPSTPVLPTGIYPTLSTCCKHRAIHNPRPDSRIHQQQPALLHCYQQGSHAQTLIQHSLYAKMSTTRQ
jgi:hypothetical protein